MKANVKVYINNNLIYDYLEKEHINKKEFAKICGITLYALQEILNGNANFGISKYVKIAVTLGVKLSELVKF